MLGRKNTGSTRFRLRHESSCDGALKDIDDGDDLYRLLLPGEGSCLTRQPIEVSREVNNCLESSNGSRQHETE